MAGYRDVIDKLQQEYRWQFDDCCPDGIAIEAALESAGYCIVPMEPTREMQNAGWREIDTQGFATEDTEVAPVYRSMIRARPKD